MNRTRRAATIVVAAVATAAAASLAIAGDASAHVTVSSTEATQGGYAVVAVRVPTESDTASTTKVQLQMPTATPFASVGVQAISGWKDSTTTTKLAKPLTNDDGDSITSAVSQVTWTAKPGSSVTPGHFQQFFIQVGPLPDVPSVTFKAIQTYSDGSVVRWIETAAPGATDEPEHPAPVLTLAPAAGSSDGTSSQTPASVQPTLSLTKNAAAKSSSSNTGAVVVSIIALVVALGALGLAFASRTRGRKKAV